MSAGGPGVRSPHGFSWQDGLTPRTGIHISPGSSVTAVDTNSSVKLLLDLPCLSQLIHLLMCCTGWIRTLQLSFWQQVPLILSKVVGYQYTVFLWKAEPHVFTFCWKTAPCFLSCDLKQMCHQKRCPALVTSQVWVQTTVVAHQCQTIFVALSICCLTKQKPH